MDFLLELQKNWDDTWLEADKANDEKTKFEISTIAITTVCDFSAGLRREELRHIRLCNTFLWMSKSIRHPRLPHVIACGGMVEGQIAQRWHKIPLV